MRLLLLALSLAAGCDQLLGVGDVHQAPDGGLLAGGTIHGTSTVTWIHPDGTTSDVADDLSRYTVRALVHDATGFHAVTGAGTATGDFTIANVPAGETYVELTRPDVTTRALYRVDRTELDAGYLAIGHAGPVATTTTPVTFHVDKMTAWAAGDGLHAVSFGAGADFDPSYPQPSGAAIGDTALTTSTIDWGDTIDPNAPPRRLVAQGDDVWVTHLRPSNGFNVIVDAAQLAAQASMTDGVAATFTGSFSPVAASRMQSVLIDAASYYAKPGADQRPFTYSCYLYAGPGASHDLAFGAPLWGQSGQASPAAEPPQATASFGSPFPSTWPEVVHCDFGRLESFLLPGFGHVQLLVHAYADAASGAIVSIGPTQQPVAAPTINGVAFTAGGLLKPGDVEHIAWTPAANATQYQVAVRRFVLKNGRLTVDVSATVDTTTSSIDLPPDVLAPGAYYVISVWAISAQGGLQAGQLRRTNGIVQRTQLQSTRFRSSDHCGDHVVDPDEDCDDGGESATCNVDCTKPACGDGILDQAAGEQCDDGNGGDGDGCSPLCQKD